MRKQFDMFKYLSLLFLCISVIRSEIGFISASRTTSTFQKNDLKLAQRLNGVSESATLKLNATVQMMKTKGIDVINLTVGEPDFCVPDAANEAIMSALRANYSKYTPIAGILELRKAVAARTNLQQPSLAKNHPWEACHVVVTNGGKQALFNSIMSLLNPGDEVLIPSPYWASYPEITKIAGGIPKFISTSLNQGFKIKPHQLQAALGPKVKLLILNSPNNPTGAIYTRNEYAALADVLLKHPEGKHVWVISDEIYDRIILDKIPSCSFLEAAPALYERTITVNSMSKSAAMTGWRVGWSVASEWVTQRMITLQGQSTSGVNSLAQCASLAVLKLPESNFFSQIEIYKKRKELILEILQKVSNLKIVIPHGAFYVFVGIEKYLRAGEDAITFAQRLLEEAKVAVVPGTPFGEPKFVRLSFATDEQFIREGCERIVRYLG
jgi:aspartate aminotransferase